MHASSNSKFCLAQETGEKRYENAYDKRRVNIRAEKVRE